MNRKIFTLLVATICSVGMFAQNPSLVTASSDLIDHTGFPTAPLLVQSDAESFYWIGGSYQGSSVNHPLLSDKVTSDFSNIYFMRYDKLGNPFAAAAISGTNIIPQAFPTEGGGLTLVGSASEDVLANGNPVPINAANRLEFIAKYNDLCQFEKIIPIWDLEPSQYPNSVAMMDTATGNLFLAGTSYQALNLLGHGEVLGKGLADFLYVLRYDRNLELTGVFTAGFDEENSEWGSYGYLKITPGKDGSVVISGAWMGDREPIIAGDTLSSMVNSTGIFTFKLDEEFNKEWVLEGSLEGNDYDGFSGISEGMALSNGDFVLVGATSTGYFSLGEVKLEYPNGAGYSNMFAFRLSSDGGRRWESRLENMDEAYDNKKKSTNSDEFTGSMEWDAIQWKEEVLYLAGKFSGDQFKVDERPMENSLGFGIFVAALDMGTGEENWGYALSSDRTDLHGFDLDASGNVSLMGRTGSTQEYQDFGSETVDGTDLIFHLGLDNQGNHLWHNNAYNSNLGYNTYGTDLEVLKGGEVFSTMYKTVPDPVLIGGVSISSKDPYSCLLVGLNADNLLGGKVTDKDGNIVYPGVVRAYKITERGAYPLVKTVDIDPSGSYRFTGLYPSHYTLRVIPDKDAYPNGMPTYMGGGIFWADAPTDDTPVSADTRATFLDVTLSQLAPLTELDGKGLMSGNISYADDFIYKGTQARPVTGKSVILKKKAASKGTQEGDVVAYVETNEVGEYVFEYVPDGAYFMIVDVPGLPMSNNYDVELVDNMIVSELDFVVGNDDISPPGSTDIGKHELSLVSLYPNPGQGMLNMKFRRSGDYTVRVFDAVGKMQRNIFYPSGSGKIDMDLTDLDQGLYLINIESNFGSETIKYVKE